MTRTVRLTALAAAAALALAACGADGADNVEPVATQQDVAGQETAGHDHAAPADLTEWAGAKPDVAVAASANDGAVVLDLTLGGFTLSSLGAADGDGHLHVSVDGGEGSMYFDEQVALGTVDEGVHHVEIGFNANEHGAYSLSGEPLTSDWMLTVHEDGSVTIASSETTDDHDHAADHDEPAVEDDHDDHDEPAVEDDHDHDHEAAAGEPTPYDAAVADADTVVEVHIVGGEPSDGPREIEVHTGSIVAVKVFADAADTIHVHGYDILRVIPADSHVEFAFSADIPGAFEVEIEGSGHLVFELVVS